MLCKCTKKKDVQSERDVGADERPGKRNKRWHGGTKIWRGLFPNRRRAETSRNQKQNERRAPPVSQSAARRSDNFFVRPRLSVTFRPYRSNRGRNRNRPWAVGGHALKAKKKCLSKQVSSSDKSRTCERHAGQLLRPVSSHRSTQSLWNTCRQVNNLRSSSGS